MHVHRLTYDPGRDSYRVCSAECGDPIGAHVQCIRDQLLATGTSVFTTKCAQCEGVIQMRCVNRLAIREWPYTLLELARFALKHFALIPFMLCYVWFFMLYLNAWIEYRQGLADRPPVPIHMFKYAWVSGTNPGFEFDANTWGEKWTHGMALYLIWICFIFVWSRFVWPPVVYCTRGIFWRYS